MNPDQIREMLTGDHIATPFTIHTYSGQSYRVEDAASIWHPPGLEGVLAIAVPRMHLAVVRLDAISEVTCEEHEAAAAARK